MVTLASGPLVYCLESVDNGTWMSYSWIGILNWNLFTGTTCLVALNIIKAIDKEAAHTLTAIPYYAVGNRNQSGYKVWIPGNQKD